MAKGLFEFAAPVKIYVKELAMDYCDLSRHYWLFPFENRSDCDFVSNVAVFDYQAGFRWAQLSYRPFVDQFHRHFYRYFKSWSTKVQSLLLDC